MPPGSATPDRRIYGVLPDGTSVEEFTLTASKVELRAITLGAIITALRVPDNRGGNADIVLAYDALDRYLENTAYLGAVVGRYANRIAFGRFHLHGREYSLATNDGPHHLHGGWRGFDRHVWTAQPLAVADGAAVRFFRTSPDGEEGYPAAVDVSVTYRLTSAGDVEIEYAASSDGPTIINLTQHSYFNLSDEDADICDHMLWINADSYTPVDSGLIPAGTIEAVAGTPLDFRTPTRIGARIDAPHPQLRHAGGYDHNWVLNERDAGVRHAATLESPGGGRALEVWTDQPGLQFYSGNFLTGNTAGAGGRVLGYRAGCCLETQHFPDSPNHPGFPSTVLHPDHPYRSRTIWRFAAC
jgi:aldose 1-epimerase